MEQNSLENQKPTKEEKQNIPSSHDKEIARLEEISGQLKFIKSTIGQKRRREYTAWRDGVFFGLIALVLFFQIGLFRRMDKSDVEEILTDDTPAMTTELATENSGDVATTEAPTEQTEAPTEQTEAPLPSYPTLYDWLQNNPPLIKVYVVEETLHSAGVGATLTLTPESGMPVEVTPAPPQEIEIAPVLENLYIVNFSKEDLDNKYTQKTFRISIFIDKPDSTVDKYGCLVVKSGTDTRENCSLNLDTPIIIEVPVVFATYDDGKTTVCNETNTTLGKEYYRDAVVNSNMSIEWVTDSDTTELNSLLEFQLVSNLVMLNKTVNINTTYATSCEAVLVLNSPPINNNKVSVFSFRSGSEGEISIDDLNLFPGYKEWLLAP